MNTLTHISPRAGSVVFGASPRYGRPVAVAMPSQTTMLDSNYQPYVYQRAAEARVLHRLFWSNRSKAILDSLLAFVEVADGCRHGFTWSDHLGNNHLVTFPRDGLQWKQTGHDRYEISFALEEVRTLTMTYVDEFGETLVDENGDALMW